MNKQELIEKNANSDRVYGEKNYVALEDVLVLVKQLDEPQKVKVSEEEAKFLETFDFNCEIDVTTALYHVSRVGWGYYLKNNNGIELKDLSEGFRELENRKRLIKAILDGYEVKKEKRYLVKVKGVYLNSCLVFDKGNKKWFFSSIYEIEHQIGHHTRKELEEAGFGWVFDCPGVEVEEVTE